MKALLVCASISHGNTRAVAERMAGVLDAVVRAPDAVDPDSLDAYDLIGFGSGIYFMSMHPSLRELVRSLPDLPAMPAFVFATSGTPELPWLRPTDMLARELEGKGLDVLGTFTCRGLDTVGPLGLIGGINKGHPDEADLARAEQFATDLRARVTGDRPGGVDEGRR